MTRPCTKLRSLNPDLTPNEHTTEYSFINDIHEAQFSQDMVLIFSVLGVLYVKYHQVKIRIIFLSDHETFARKKTAGSYQPMPG